MENVKDAREKYVLAVDQSTSGTKALLLSPAGALLGRCDRSHRQLIDERGWISHDPEEIWTNTVAVIQEVIEKTGIDKSRVAAIGISNQRETAVAWDKASGQPVCPAIVWQCARSEAICARIAAEGHASVIQSVTGLPLSPYFSASKWSWMLQNIPRAAEAAAAGNLCCGTMDSWLLAKLTDGRAFKTDYSNASRTQLFNLRTLSWDDTVCGIFGLEAGMLPEVCDSNSFFGETDLGGFFQAPVPIHGVLGDSHAALFGQGCLERGMIKATYGTGSSVMMNTGPQPVFTDCGIATSIAWGMDGRVDYVLEGNINYTGAVIKWIVDDLGLIASAKDAAAVAASANPADGTYLVPAFSGLGAPYWDSKAKAILCGMSRQTGRAEIVRAAEECIAYQIADIVEIMEKESGIQVKSLRVDGGPTRDAYLMPFQCDILGTPVEVPDREELSGVGAAYAAGLAIGVFQRNTVFAGPPRRVYTPSMGEPERELRRKGWKQAVQRVLGEGRNPADICPIPGSTEKVRT